jgi:hypothetical protein
MFMRIIEMRILGKVEFVGRLQVQSLCLSRVVRDYRKIRCGVVHGSASADDIGGGLRGEHSIEDEERNFKNRTLVLLPFKGCGTRREKTKVQKPHPLRTAKDGPPSRQRLKQRPITFELTGVPPAKFTRLKEPTPSSNQPTLMA